MGSNTELEPENKKTKLEDSSNGDGEDNEQKLSKKQRKRMMKKEIWLANLPAKRAKEKAKIKERRREARAQNISLGPTRKELKLSTMSSSKCKISVALDFSFEDLMSTKDIAKCINQVLRCYSLNRRAKSPMQFHVVNFNGKKSLAEMEKHNGYLNWDVSFHSKSYMDVFDKNSLVYLTSDSDNVIENLEDDKVYIIGALVDHNAHKGLCLKVAMDQGISHGQLPIGEHLKMKTRKVLAINHVFEIMLLVCNDKTWRDAFVQVLPQRKGAIEIK